MNLNNLTEFLLSKNPISSADGDVNARDGITILSRIIDNLDEINQLGTDYQGPIVNEYDPLEEIASSIFESFNITYIRANKYRKTQYRFMVYSLACQ